MTLDLTNTYGVARTTDGRIQVPMTLDQWPDDKLEQQMIADAGSVGTDVGCHVRALLSRVRELEAACQQLEVSKLFKISGKWPSPQEVEDHLGKLSKELDFAFLEVAALAMRRQREALAELHAVLKPLASIMDDLEREADVAHSVGHSYPLDDDSRVDIEVKHLRRAAEIIDGRKHT